MFIFAHLGLGYGMTRTLAGSKRLKLPLGFLLLGTLLPDIIDKLLYYGLVALTGHRGAENGIIAGTRSFGHTLLFLFLLLVLSAAFSSLKILAVAIGVFTHLFLDQFSDLVISGGKAIDDVNLLWPLRGWSFPTTDYQGFGEQLGHLRQPAFLIFECLGIIILLWLLRDLRRGRPS